MGTKKRTPVKPRKPSTRPARKPSAAPAAPPDHAPAPPPPAEEIQKKVLDGLLSVVRRLRRSLGS